MIHFKIVCRDLVCQKRQFRPSIFRTQKPTRQEHFLAGQMYFSKLRPEKGREALVICKGIHVWVSSRHMLSTLAEFDSSRWYLPALVVGRAVRVLDIVASFTNVVYRVGMAVPLLRQKIGLLQVYVPLSVQGIRA